MAFAVGILYAAVSVYWGIGGTWLLDTVGGSLERRGRAGDAGVLLAVWPPRCSKRLPLCCRCWLFAAWPIGRGLGR